MTITAYLYNSCTSCRKTDDVLRSSGVEYERREYFRDRFSKEELATLLEDAGLTVQDVLSTRSTPYRERGLASKELTDDEVLDLMIEDPRLLRRPIVVSDRGVIVGHNEKKLRELIGDA